MLIQPRIVSDRLRIDFEEGKLISQKFEASRTSQSVKNRSCWRFVIISRKVSFRRVCSRVHCICEKFDYERNLIFTTVGLHWIPCTPTHSLIPIRPCRLLNSLHIASISRFIKKCQCYTAGSQSKRQTINIKNCQEKCSRCPSEPASALK